MKANKALTLALAALVAALVAGCDNKPAVQPLPEVNDANCAPEKIKAMPTTQQQEFSSLCLRRSGDFKPSPKKEWCGRNESASQSKNRPAAVSLAGVFFRNRSRSN